MMQNTIKPLAEIEWRNGQPYASKFQDVYFSTDNGLLESEYVFLLGNDLSTRWQQPNIQKFIIAETGFGTGLNFLCAAKLWLESTPSNATLHYISVEKYPLSLENIMAALALWPELSRLSQPLLTQYKSLFKDSKAILFNNRVQLSLLIGACHMSGFLAGEKPSKNHASTASLITLKRCVASPIKRLSCTLLLNNMAFESFNRLLYCVKNG